MPKDLKKSVTGKIATGKKTEVISKATNEVTNKVTRDYTVLLNRGMFSPCCGCNMDDSCSPSICDMLAKWL